jgi:hypothetical protein
MLSSAQKEIYNMHASLNSIGTGIAVFFFALYAFFVFVRRRIKKSSHRKLFVFGSILMSAGIGLLAVKILDSPMIKASARQNSIPNPRIVDRVNRLQHAWLIRMDNKVYFVTGGDDRLVAITDCTGCQIQARKRTDIIGKLKDSNWMYVIVEPHGPPWDAALEQFALQN